MVYWDGCEYLRYKRVGCGARSLTALCYAQGTTSSTRRTTTTRSGTTSSTPSPRSSTRPSRRSRPSSPGKPRPFASPPLVEHHADSSSARTAVTSAPRVLGARRRSTSRTSTSTWCSIRTSTASPPRRAARCGRSATSASRTASLRRAERPPPPPPLPLTFGHASRFKSKLDLKSQVGDAYPPTSSAGSISTTPGHDTDEHLHFFDERFFNDNLFGFLAGRNNKFLCSGSVTAFQLVRDSALSASPFDSLDSAFSCLFSHRSF